MHVIKHGKWYYEGLCKLRKIPLWTDELNGGSVKVFKNTKLALATAKWLEAKAVRIMLHVA